MNSDPQQLNSQKVKVKILLSGGHEYAVYLPTDAPLLQSLLETIANSGQQPATEQQRVFHIPLDGGRSALYFQSHHLVGVVTEPPVELTPQIPPEAEIESVLPSKVIQIDNLLTFKEKQQLLNYVLQQETNFVATTTYPSEQNYRQSLVLYSFGEWEHLIVQRLQAILPSVVEQLGSPQFTVSQIETQLTAHNDGGYYKLHNDNGSPDTTTREISFVYYFYREPKSFSGGKLKIYDSKIENNLYVKADSFQIIEPRNNSIVFFLSRYLHEVLPVICPSRAFADSRYTVNGWIRR